MLSLQFDDVGVTEQLEVGDLSLDLTDHVQVLDGLSIKDFNGNFGACENVLAI